MNSLKKELPLLKHIFSLFLGWKLILFFITFLGLSLIPNFNAETGSYHLANPDLDYWKRWTSNWDGGHYRGIAENGYRPEQTVFFPFYPLLIKTLMILNINSIPGSLIVSNLCLLFSCYLIYKLARLDYDQKKSLNIIFILLIFPTSFYLQAAYSEALFLSLSLSAFYFARTKRWFLAFLFASLTSITRLSGLLVLTALASEYFLKEDITFKLSYLKKTYLRKIFILLLLATILLNYFLGNLLNLNIFPESLLLTFNQLIYYLTLIFLILVILEFITLHINKQKLFNLKTLLLPLTLIPLTLYIYYQKIKFNNPFGFITNEELWERQLSAPWNPVITYFDNFLKFGFEISGFSGYTSIEIIAFLIATIALIFSLKLLRFSYTLYFLLMYLLPLFSNTLIGYHRYLLVIFPMFFVFSYLNNNPLQKIALFFSITLLALLSIMFLNGYWVT